MTDPTTPRLASEGDWLVFSAAMNERFPFVLFAAPDDVFHAIIVPLVEAQLPALTVPINLWLQQWAQSIGPAIFIPPEWPPETKIRVLVHEVTHYTRWRERPFAFIGWYLARGEDRGHEEALAYAAQAEITSILTGVVPSLDDMAHSTDGPAYLLTAAQKGFVRSILEVRRTQIAAGVIQSHVALAAADIIRAHLPHLLPHEATR